jgi:hypothetical protein
MPAPNSITARTDPTTITAIIHPASEPNNKFFRVKKNNIKFRKKSFFKYLG